MLRAFCLAAVAAGAAAQTLPITTLPGAAPTKFAMRGGYGRY